MNQFNFEVTLDLFDGPIDLLLHLVKMKELPIEKISLAIVAEQYVEYVAKMRMVDFEILGEYLVIASTLLAIKASFLLKEPIDDIEIRRRSQLESNQPDPHEILLAKLREAEVFKYGAGALLENGMLGVDVFEPVHTNESVAVEAKLRKHDPFMLGKALKKLLDKKKRTLQSIEFTYDSLSVAESMLIIIQKIQTSDEPILFDTLVDGGTVDGNESGASLTQIVVNFIAILELVKRLVITVKQEGVFESIYIQSTPRGGDLTNENHLMMDPAI
jgi:segregation and condensation protein A